MTTAIKIEHLSKKYIIGHQRQERYTSLRDVMMHNLRGLGQRIRHPLLPNREVVEMEELWALRHIDLEIKQGERVGIIGRNGAGKSTLLKVLSRITEPTEGRFTMNGRVASLLEVGTGFHPELTGRENIFLNGAILGMSKKEIKRKFDEIVAFAETEKFLDTPVKRYSSGMYVRLAFAVAARLQPEILIVDEVLAVGDAAFQKKCLGRMKEVGSEGRTVLFVSHNMAAVRKLCDRVIWLEDGKLYEDGATESVVSAYLQQGHSNQLETVWPDDNSAPGNENARLLSVKVRPDDGSSLPTVSTPISISFKFRVYRDYDQLNLSLVINSLDGVCVFNSTSKAVSVNAGIFYGRCFVPGSFFNDNLYSVRILLVQDMSVPLVDLDNIHNFEVTDVPREGLWFGKRIGLVRPNLEWKLGQSEENGI